MYVADVDLPAAGTWGADSRPRPRARPPRRSDSPSTSGESTPTVQVGDQGAGLEDADRCRCRRRRREDLDRRDAGPGFYKTSVADALAANKPFVLVFATPKFCT